MFDALVIGGSLAGGAAALELAKRGCRVAVVEKAPAARRKACGEGLTAFGFETLSELGLQISAKPIRAYSIWKNGRSPAILEFGNELATYGAQRIHLDRAMRSKLASHTEPFWGEAVREIGEENEGYRVITDSRELRGRSLILADGAHSHAAKQLRILESAGAKNLYGASLVCRSSTEVENVHVFVRSDFEVYLTPVGDGLVNVSAVGSRESVRRLIGNGELQRELDRISLQIPLDQVEEVLVVGALGPLRRPAYVGRAFLVGDACQTLDPLCGMGMTQALLSGRRAGIAAAAALNKEKSWSDALKEYANGQKQLCRTLTGYSRLAELMVRRFHANLPMELASRTGLSRTVHSAAFGRGPVSSFLSLCGASL